MNKDPIENRIGKLAGQLSNVVLLGFFTVLCSLPVFTIGAAFTALHQSMHAYLFLEEDKPLRVFFSSFKEHFVLATKVFLLHILAIAILLWDLVYYRTGDSFVDHAGQIVSFVLLCFIVLELLLVFVLIGLDEVHGIKEAFIKAFDIVSICPFRCFLLLVLHVAVILSVVFLLRGLFIILPGILSWCSWQFMPEILRIYRIKRKQLEYREDQRKS